MAQAARGEWRGDGVLRAGPDLVVVVEVGDAGAALAAPAVSLGLCRAAARSLTAIFAMLIGHAVTDPLMGGPT